MTKEEANEVLMKYYDKSSLTEEEEFELIETLKYLIEHPLFDEQNFTFAEWLGGIYYDKRMFDLALKYYELAEMQGSRWAWNGLGYIWYYGRTGTIDYEKAYRYFKKMVDYDGDEFDQRNKMEAWFKIADMYKNGYYIEKDYEKYKQIIEDLYEKERNGAFGSHRGYAPLYTRLAGIRSQEGRKEEAIELYLEARRDLIFSLRTNRFFGDLNRINWLVNDLYKLIDFDPTDFDLYDLYYLLKEEHLVSFRHRRKKHEIESVLSEEGEMNIRFDDTWYRNISDFFNQTDLNGESIEHEYYDLDDWRIVR